MLHFDETRRAAVQEAARRIFYLVGAIAIGAVMDLMPDKIAEAAIGVGIAALLTAAIAPLRLLPRSLGRSMAEQTSG